MVEKLNTIMTERVVGFTPREIFFKYLRFLPWMIFSLVTMVLLAHLKLRYSTPIYVVNAKLQVKNQGSSSGVGEKFDDIFMMQTGRSNIGDEIDIIKSRQLAKRVVTYLGLQMQYVNKGQLRSTEIHPGEMPFTALCSGGIDSAKAMGFLVEVTGDQEFQVNKETEKHFFDRWFTVGQSKWMLRKTGRKFSDFASPQFVVTWTPLEDVAAALSNSIKVVRNDNFTNILLISYETDNVNLGKDILNQYMVEYQQFNLEDKRIVAMNTNDFIDEQLDTVRAELGSVERSSKDYREENKVIDPESQTRLYLENIDLSRKQISDQEIKLKLVDKLISVVSDERNPFRLVPTTLGIEDPSLIQQFGEYNKMLMQREVTLTNTPKNNPIVVSQEVAIRKLRSDILNSLQNIRNTFKLYQEEIEQKNVLSERQVIKVPAIQKRLLEIGRQQKILEELYSYLLQKKLETSIGSASTISNIRVVEQAYDIPVPIRPDRKSTYLLSIFIGLLLPTGVIFIIEYLNDRVLTKRDVQRTTDTPILGEVGHSHSNTALVVGKNNRKIVAEQFRVIRTNLQYILNDKNKKVVMLTSSFSGEGKSFVSTNLAGVIALTGKKTVILEFDIRKPKIIKGLNMRLPHGITNYIVGSCQVEELPTPVPGFDSLYVISCGPVPPNPAELLLDPKIEKIFDFARKEFDMVVIDTAPVGLVSDALTLGTHADATIYIVRHNYTQKRQLQLIQDLYVNKKLPSMSVVINDIKAQAGYGGYYGYGSYNYGYGYGSSRPGKNGTNDYYEVDKDERFSILKWLNRR